MANSTLSPEQLPDANNPIEDGPDPLEQLGYNEATTPAERLLEIEQAEQQNQDQQQEAQARLQQQAREQLEREAKKEWLKRSEKKVESGQKRIKGETTSAEEATGQAGKQVAGKEASQVTGQATKQAGKEVVRDIEKQAVRKVEETVARQVASKAATSAAVAAAPEIGVGVAIIAAVGILILVIVVVIFLIYGVSGSNSGGGLPKKPSTTAEYEQATLLAGLAGDAIANNKTVAEVVKDEKERYARIKQNAQDFDAGLVPSIEAKIIEFTPILDSLLGAGDKAGKRVIVTDLQAKMVAFEATLPFGNWTSQLALSHQSEGSLRFCKITGAGANVACASFVSTVMWEAGIPNPIQAAVDGIWREKRTRVVVERGNQSASYYDEQKSNLKPGDIIFWGDGKCSDGGSTLFDHVGIYVGNDEAVDNSSSQEKILKRGAASRDSCRVFNGAKRYGKD